MANRLEIAKFNTLLQNPRAIERFKTLFHQVHLLSLSHNIKATEGELMAVCAYLTGREFAGSLATREACTRLGCMSFKTFDRVHDTVQNIMRLTRSTDVLTVHSLAQKYQFPSEQLEMVQAIQNILHMSIPTELQDERVVCGIFALICNIFRYNSEQWINAEATVHDIEMEEMKTMIERVTVVHGDQIKTVIQRYQEPGRVTRGQISPIKRHSLPGPASARPKAPAMKRPAPEDSSPRKSPAKRRKAEPETSPISSATSLHQSASPVPPTQVTSLSLQSNPSLADLLEDEDDNVDAFSEPLESASLSPVELDFLEEDVQMANFADLDWTALSQLRRRAMTKKLRETASLPYLMSRVAFADREFWRLEN